MRFHPWQSLSSREFPCTDPFPCCAGLLTSGLAGDTAASSAQTRQPMWLGHQPEAQLSR